MLPLFQVSFSAVLQLVLCALVGCWLAHRNILNAEGRRTLSKIIMGCLLPGMLVSSLSKDADWEHVRLYFPVVLSAAVIALGGFLLGHLMNFVLRVPKPLRRITAIASCMSNASYVPMPFLGVICISSPFILSLPAEQRNTYITYVSLYLVCHSPLLWTFGYPYLSGKNIRELKLSQIITPPIMASTSGICIALIPGLRGLFYGDGAPLNVVMGAFKLLGQGVFPCALLLLGANLLNSKNNSDNADDSETTNLPWRAYSAVAIAKLILLPIFGFFLTMFLWNFRLIPHDPLCALVIMIEAAAPPANNLIIMCQAYEKGVTMMARLLFVTYCLCVITLTLWTMLFLHSIETWT